MFNKITFFLVKKNRIIACALCFLLIVFIFQTSFLGQSSVFCAHDNFNGNYRDGELLVKLKNSENIYKIKIPEDEFLPKAISNYLKNPAVQYAEPNYLYQAAIIPSDRHFSDQWYLNKISAPDAWDAVSESPGITIAVLDSGVMIDHPDLKPNIWTNSRELPENGIDDDQNGFIDDINGWDFVNNVADPRPKFSEGFTQEGVTHGTIIAGIIAAAGNNNQGITGITWRAKIMPIKVLDDKGEGDTGNIIKAIDYAANNGADIINLSFVGTGFSRGLDAAVRRAAQAGIIIVAAAGNDQSQIKGVSLDNNPVYPACHDGDNGENFVIGVAATDPIDQKADFSNFGRKCVDISAPGISIFSTSVYAPERNTAAISLNLYYDGYWSGTSMAAPMVSGTAALVSAINPGLNKKAVKEMISQGADDISRLNPDYLSQLGAGRLNVFKSVISAKNELLRKNYVILNIPASINPGQIKGTGPSGNLIFKYNAYEEGIAGNMNIAAGDLDGDGKAEIITGFGAQVKVFDYQGNLLTEFFAYHPNFRGGVFVATADLNSDGADEIITGAGPGGGPHIRIFDKNGNLKGQFFAYDKNFRGGVSVATGDLNNDGADEIITGAGPGGGPHIRIFDKNGNLKGQFFAYDKNFRGGVNVSSGNVFGGLKSAQKEIIVAPKKGGGPHIRIFNMRGQVLSQFFAFDKKFKNGVSIFTADINQDGVDEIITGAGPGGAPHVRIFKNNGQLVNSYYAFEEKFSGGVNVSAVNSP